MNDLTPGPNNTSLIHYRVCNNKLVFNHNGYTINGTDGTTNFSVSITPSYTIPPYGGLYSCCYTPNSGFYAFNTDIYTTGLSQSSSPPNYVDSIVLFKIDGMTNALSRIKTLKYQAGCALSGFGMMKCLATWPAKFVLQETQPTCSSLPSFIISDGTTGGTYTGPIYPTYIKLLQGNSSDSTIIPLFGTDMILPIVTSSSVGLYTMDYNTYNQSLISNILPGYGTYLNYITMNNKMYFMGDDGSTGMEPWVTDGTAAGTFLLQAIYPGATGGPDDMIYSNDAAIYMKRAGNNIFFAANEGINGIEPWVMFSDLAGINEHELSSMAFNAYPNPSHDELSITYSLSKASNEGTVKLIEAATGRVLAQQAVYDNHGVMKFDLERLSPGIYLVSLQQKDLAPQFIKVAHTR